MVAREDVPGDQRLVGYVVAAGEEPLVREELRTLLKKNVPDYMVPSAFVLSREAAADIQRQGRP